MASDPGSKGTLPSSHEGGAAKRALNRLDPTKMATDKAASVIAGKTPADGKSEAGMKGVAGGGRRIAAGALKGAAGASVEGKLAAGGLTGAAAGAGRAVLAKQNRKAAGWMILSVVSAPAMLVLAMLLVVTLVMSVFAATDEPVTQRRAQEAAVSSGFEDANLAQAYSSAARNGIAWESVAALEYWQTNQPSQVFCPPTPAPAPVAPGDPAPGDPAPGDEPVTPGEAENVHPVDGDFTVSSPFGMRLDDGEGGSRINTGLDFIAEAGTPIVAAGDGEVVYSGWNDTGGNMVWVDLEGESVPPVRLKYLHLAETSVQTGDEMLAGTPIGIIGKTGRASDIVLHFEVLVDNSPTDPAKWLTSVGVDPNNGLPVGGGFTTDPCSRTGNPALPIIGQPSPPGQPADPDPGGGISDGAFPGAPATTCAPTGHPAEGGLQPDSLRAMRCTVEAFPGIQRLYGTGSRPAGYKSDHPAGRAVDYAVGNYRPEGVGAGYWYMYAIAHWTQVNADDLGVKYIIYGDMRWARETGWVPYSYPRPDIYTDSTRHLDHVHVSYFGTSAMPGATNLIPAFADQSGMPWTEQTNPAHWRFLPVDRLQLDGFPTDGTGGLLIGDGGNMGPVGDYRSAYYIDRRAFGPSDGKEEEELEARLQTDADFAREWNGRVDKGWVASTVESSEELAERADEDHEYATNWIAYEMGRQVQIQPGVAGFTDISAGRSFDYGAEEVTAVDAKGAADAKGAYVSVLQTLPVQGMSPSRAAQVYDLALAWHLGQESASAGGTGLPGVVCAPAGDQPLVVEAVGGVHSGEQVTMDAKRLNYAAVAVHVAKERGINTNGQLAMLMTIFAESRFLMYANSGHPESLALPHDAVGSDNSSAGLYQQLILGAWGPVGQIMDTAGSTDSFLGFNPSATAPGLTDIPGWETMPPGPLAQAVQVSAHPDRYAQWQQASMTVLGKVEGIECSSPAEETT